MALADAAAWLASTPVSAHMRSNLWLYPVVEIFHILGFAVLVGGVSLFDLRVLGFARALPVDTLGRHLLPWSVASLGLVVPAGLLMLSADPHGLLGNPVFQLKLSLIALAGVNALIFHAGVYRGVAAWNIGATAPPAARLQAIVSLLLWVAIISCGRLLAYV
ncbi:MAG TPA: DUF6644 family protein [Telluria sp.]|nr:DUF6644 family protein [Telluria sp.]